ncbi:MAG TPA: glycosyltransferase [Planctomycetota bacterium]|nr:glycosyltransferase [Planctomycetota bacterium]HRR80915.1 glycosyltransferase [Planctomycetota bacterium]HRT93857.1 glycosyltransferase [Planctomycetota bacterium]
MPDAVDLSIIAPMFNEEESIADTARRVREAMAGFAGSWELVMVDDGSTDASRARAEAEAARDPRVRVVGYTPNAGRGRALRTGFAAARGAFVVSVDFDLSYEPSHILRMHEALRRAGGPDIVLASAYMPGGTSAGVPWKRLLPSRLGNWLLRFAWPERIYTSTCIVRGYRREALERLTLTEDGKDIHLEILSQAFERGLRIEEIPGHLRARARGKSKARLGGTIGSHLGFLARRRPGLCAAVAAATLAFLAVAAWLALRSLR